MKMYLETRAALYQYRKNQVQNRLVESLIQMATFFHPD